MKEQIKACQEALKRNPNDREAFSTLAQLLKQARRWKAIIGLYEAYPEMADWTDLVQALKEHATQETQPEKRSVIFHIMGQILEFKIGDTNDAIKCYQYAVKTWPLRSESFDAARRLYISRNNVKMAVKLIEVELSFENLPLERKAKLYAEMASICTEYANAPDKAEKYAAMARATEQKALEMAQQREAEVADDRDESAEVAEEKAEVAEEKAEEAVAVEEPAVKEAAEVAEEPAVEEAAEVAEESVAVEEAAAVEEPSEAAEEAATVEEAAAVEEPAAVAEEKTEEAAIEESTAVAEEKVEEAAIEESTAVAEEKTEEVAVEESAAVAEEKTEEVAVEESAAVAEEKTEEVAVEEPAEVAEESSERVAIPESFATISDCCDEIFRLNDTNTPDAIEDVALKGVALAQNMEDAEPIFEALEEVEQYGALAVVLADLCDRTRGDSEKRLLKADRADVLDLRLDKRAEAVEIATPIAEGEDRASFKARAVLAGTDHAELTNLAATMNDLLKKLRRTPEEMPLIGDLAELYDHRMDSPKDAEEQYKRIKLAEPKNTKMLRFYCRYYEAASDWQRVLSTLQTLKGAVAGTYRELLVARQIARVSEEKLNNPNKAVSVWNQFIKEGLFVETAREALIGLYTRTGKFQNLLEIYKNDLEALAPEQTKERIEVIKKCIEINDKHTNNDAMVIKLYHQILSIDPDNDEAVNALVERYEASKRWNDLLKVLNQKAERTTDKEASVQIYYRIANLWSKSLANVNKSIEPLLKVVEIDPTQRPALQQLHDFYEQKNNWANLYDIIDKEADVADAAEKVTLLKRQAEIGEANLHSPEKAIESWEKLSQCLEDPSEALAELARLYKKQGNFEALLANYQRALEFAHSQSEKIDDLNAIAQIYLTKLDNREKGIETLTGMLDIEEGRQDALDQLTQIRVEAKEWSELVALYTSIGRAEQVYELLDLTAADEDEEETQIELYNLMAKIAQDELHSDDMAIAAYEKILDVDATHEETAKRLLKYYREHGDHKKAIEAIQIIIAWTSDLEEKIAMHVEIAELYENELDDIDHAANWYAKVVALAPSRKALRDHFEDLALRGEAYALIYDVYKPLLDSDQCDAESKVDIHRVFARVCQKHLDKSEEAMHAWEVCLAADANDTEALDALEILYDDAAEYSKLLEVIDRKLELATDPDSIMALAFKRAKILVDQLNNTDMAEVSYLKVLSIDENNVDAIRGLKAIYDVTENWTKLADILKKECDIATSSEDRLDTSFELAEIKRNHLSDLEGAIRIYDEILKENSSHARTIAVLEQLVREGIQAARIAAILEPVYATAGDTVKQCKALEISLKDLSGKERIDVLWQIFELQNGVINDSNASFEVAVRIFNETPDDERIWQHLDEIGAQIDDEETWNALANLYATVVCDAEHAEDWRYEILFKRALIVEEKLQHDKDSIALWETYRAKNLDNATAIAHLERLYRDNAEFKKLVELLEFEVTLDSYNDEERIAIELQAAQIYEDILGSSAEAIRVYRAILEIDPSRKEALDALERLYQASAQWRDLAKLYDDELSIYSETSKLNEIRCKLAVVCENEIADYERAVECYRSVLDTDKSEGVLEAASGLLNHLVGVEGDNVVEYRSALCELLEPIFVDNGDKSKLIDILRIELADVEDAYEKVELNRRIATILKDDLGDDVGAFEAMKAALKIDIADAKLREDFETLALKLDRPKEIIDLYEASMDGADDEILKHDLYKRIANVYEEKLQDNENAIKAYRIMIDLDEMDLDSLNALETLYTNDQNWELLLDILNRKSEIGSGDEKVSILRKMATINCDCLNRPKSAIENYCEILNNLPDDMDSVTALESLYEQTEDWQALCDNYGIKLQHATTDEERRDILRQTAIILEQKINAKDEAVQNYRQILDLFPRDEETLDALDKLYQAQDDFDDLASVLQRKLEIHENDDQTNILRFRLGQIYQNKLDSMSQAIEYYKAILEQNPEHEGANRSMRELLENEDYKLEASKVLESVYDRTEQYEFLAQVLEIQLEQEYDPMQQVQLLVRIACIHQDALSNYDAAFDDLARILKINQDREYIDRIESLCDILDNTAKLVDVYVEVVANVYEPEKQVAFDNRIADLLRNRLGDEKRAEEFYKTTLEVSSDDAHALEALDEIYTKRESWTDLLEILDAKFNAAKDDETRIAILYRTADTQESKCELHDDAIATYRRILEIDKRQEKAIELLSAIYESQDMWAEYVDLIRSQIADAQEQREILALKFKLAKIQNEKLGDNFDAIETLKDILNTQSDDAQARAYLEELFEKGQDIVEIAEILEPIYKAGNEWHKLIHSLEKRAEHEEDVFTKVQILEQIAKTYRYNLEDLSKALDAYGRMFLLQPADRDIQEHVERFASQTLELNVWYDLYDKALTDNLVEDDSDRRIIILSLAHLAAERMANHDKARQLCEAILADDPEEMAAYDILEWSYAQKQEYARLLELWAKKSEIVQEVDQKIGLLMRMATIQEEVLHDDAATAKTYQDILDIEPVAMPIAAALERLLRKTSQYEELADFYRQRSDFAQDDESRVEYLHKLGVVLARQLKQTAEATEVLGNALSIDKDSSACKRALEAMLNETEPTEENAEIRSSMAHLLEPLYGDDDWNKLARVLGVLIDTTDDTYDKVALYMRLADLYERHDAHPKRAFDVYAKAFVAIPNTENAREKLEELAEKLDAYAQLADVYMQAIETTEDDNEKLSLYERAAQIRCEKLDEKQVAATCYEAILALDEFNLNAIHALEKLYAQLKDYAKNVAILKKHVEIANDLIDQKDLLYKIADLQENALNQVDEAIDAYNEVLNLDPEDAVALDALERLYAQTENWTALVDIYDRKLNVSDGTSDSIGILVKIASTYRDKMGNDDEAIQYYARAFEQDRTNVDVASALETLYAKTEQYDDLITVIESQVDVASNHGDAALKHSRQIDMAHILIDNVHDDMRAIDVLKSILDDDDQNEAAIDMLQKLLEKEELVNEIAAILIPIYKQNHRDAEYMGICERKIDVAQDEFDKRSLYIEAAHVADEVLNDPDKAFGFIEKALMANPSDDEIVELAETIASRHERYTTLTVLCEKVIETADDPDASIKLSLIAAKYYEQQLTDLDKSIAQYERILGIDAMNEDALSNLHRLYRQTQQFDKLADILATRIDNGAQPINELRYELVEIVIEIEPERALELLKQILWDENDNEKAVAALESLLANKDLVGDIAEILEPRYAQNGDDEKLAKLLEAKIEVSQDPVDKLTYTKQLAQIQRDKLGDDSAALASYRNALVCDPSDADVMNAIEEIAEKIERWDDLAQAYAKAIEVASDDTDKIALMAKLAKLDAQKLGRNDEAVDVLKKILELDAENIDALRLLESIYAAENKSAELLEIRSTLALLTFEPDAQKALLFQCADLALNVLNLNERGMGFLEKIVEIDDTDLNAIDPLLVLYSEAGAFDKYVELLNKKLLSTNDDDARFDIYMTIAKTADEKLDDAAMAIDAYNDAKNIHRTPEIYAALERIYAAHEQYQDLDDLFLAQIDDTDSTAKKAALKVKRAQIAEVHFENDMDAIDLLKDALNDDPANADAFNGLDKLYSKNGEFQELYDLLEEQKKAATDENLILIFNIRIAKLAATHLGDVDTAIRSLKDVLQVQSNNVEALDSLIDIYEQQKSYDLALNALHAKIKIVDSPKDEAPIYCHVARIVRKANWSVEQIEASYQAALQRDPECEEALNELMAIAETSGDLQKTLQLLSHKAKLQSDDDAKIAVYEKIVETASQAPEFAKVAAIALQQIHELRPDDIDVSEKLVNAYIKADDFAAAKPILNGIIDSLTESKQTKKLPPFYSLKGRMLKMSGDLDGARQAFEAANAIDKNNIPNNLELGIMLFESGDYDAALKIMQTLLLHQMNVKDKEVKTNIFYYLGMLRVKTNDPKRAKDMFNRALGVDPNHAPTKAALAELG